MKVLNRFYWKNDIFKISKEIHNSDSRLLIGDKALKMKLSNNNEYEHIIDLPDTYIGSTILDKSDQYIYVSESINNSSQQ